MKKGIKIVLKSLLCLLIVIILTLVAYVSYVFIYYYRIDDNLSLEIKQAATAEDVKINQEYTIVTQNVGFGAYVQDYTFFMDGGVESRARSKDLVIETINKASTQVNALNADFILIQEVDLDSTRSFHINQKDLFDEVFTDYSSILAVNYDSPYLMYPIFHPHGASYSSIVTYSKVMMESSIRRSLPISTSLTKLLDLDRCYTKTKIKTENDKYLVIYNTHLSAYGHDESVREGQVRMLFADMKEEYDLGNYCVCGGDFNHDFTGDSIVKINGENPEGIEKLDWAQPFPIEILNEYTGINRCLNYQNDQILPTCRNNDEPYKVGNFTIIVDGFLVSENIEVTYLENIQTDFVYSDHNPVLMKFILR